MCNVTFSKLCRIFVFHPGVKNSLDMDSGGLKDYPQFFVCKSELTFFRGSLIPSPTIDGKHPWCKLWLESSNFADFSYILFDNFKSISLWAGNQHNFEF